MKFQLKCIYVCIYIYVYIYSYVYMYIVMYKCVVKERRNFFIECDNGEKLLNGWFPLLPAWHWHLADPSSSTQDPPFWHGNAIQGLTADSHNSPVNPVGQAQMCEPIYRYVRYLLFTVITSWKFVLKEKLCLICFICLPWEFIPTEKLVPFIEKRLIGNFSMS